MWTRTSTCRPNGYRFTAPYPYEVAAGGAAAGELLRGVTGSRQILIPSDGIRGGKGLSARAVPRPPVRGSGRARSADQTHMARTPLRPLTREGCPREPPPELDSHTHSATGHAHT